MSVFPGDIQVAIESTLSDQVLSATPVRGGDINQAFRLELSSKRSVFAKVHQSAPPGMFKSEAHGLSMLRHGPLRVPCVLAQDERFLILEDLGAGVPNQSHDETLGRGLAALHQTRSQLAGCSDAPGYIATLSIDNTRTSWTNFYLGRLQNLIQRAGLDAKRVTRFQVAIPRLRSLLEGAPIALLHGDLWRGNVHTDSRGAPCLVDPSSYFGDPEVDLAMMHLFGGFSTHVFDAYDEVLPPRPGSALRRGVYQLYPVLVHLLLFGGAYLGQVDSLLSNLE
ncbi:MAG: protein-ribulosamine 3-kinase [Polyangiales bacterium]